LLPIYNIEVTASHAYSISLSHLLVHNNSDRAASTRQSIRWNTLQAIRKYEEHLKWLDAAGDHLTKVLDGSAKLDDKETVMLLIKSMKDAASTSPTAPIRTRLTEAYDTILGLTWVLENPHWEFANPPDNRQFTHGFAKILGTD